MWTELTTRLTVAAQQLADVGRRRIDTVIDDARREPDRGDISVTTVIIWVAAVAGAIAIAGAIALVITKYKTKLETGT